MTPPVVSVSHLSRRFGPHVALNDVSFSLPPGRILGLLGANGAGKTTLLRTLLGLDRSQGEVMVLGQNPSVRRHALVRQVAFIADVATLPRWIRVDQLVDFMAAIHPGFCREKCARFLGRTEVGPTSVVRHLSKGMVVQLHLALVMAIDAKLLVLDEPTLGLDPLYRKAFYRALVEDYFDSERTIILSTHQVEEIEGLVTDVAFMRAGQWLGQMPAEEMERRFVQVTVLPHQVAAARTLHPLSEQVLLGRHAFVYDCPDRELLMPLGEVRPASLDQVFIAMVQPSPLSPIQAGEPA